MDLAHILLAACLTLDVISRTVMQETPQKVERVRVREWCPYLWGNAQLEMNTRIEVDGKVLQVLKEESVVLWSSVKKPDCP